MTWYFAGSEIEAFRINGNVTSYSNSSAGADTTFGPRAIQCAASGNNAYGDFSSNLTEFWFHAHITIGGAPNTSTQVQFIDSVSAASRVQLETYTIGGTFLRLGYWNGSSFTYLTALSILGNTFYDIDIHVKIDPTVGIVEFYSNGSLIDSFSGNTSAIGTSFNGFVLLGGISFQALAYQQVIVGDGAQSTVGYRLMTLAPTSSGNANNWTNGSTISNITDNNDGTNINSNTNGQISQYTCPAVPSGTWTVSSVFVAARAQNAVGGIQNLKLGIRSNSADTWSANVSGINTNYQSFTNQWATNPNNGNAVWTTGDLSTIQIGVQAVT